MAVKTSVNTRACNALIEVLHQTEKISFSKDEINISEKKNIGAPVVCSIEAHKGNGDPLPVKGQAYVYHDLVVVCIETVRRKLMEPIYPHHYEYLSY